MTIKDLFNKKKARVVATSEPITEPTSEPTSEPVKTEEVKHPSDIDQYEKVVASACETARRLGLQVFHVEYERKIYICQLLIEVDPSDYASVEDFRWDVRDKLGRYVAAEVQK